MRRVLVWLSLASLFLAGALLPAGALLARSDLAQTATPDSNLPGGSSLPGRPTNTPRATSETPQITPAVTSPFTFPTTPPELSPTPAQDCIGVFPLENVEAIEFGKTTLPQLEASFGKGNYRGGRSMRFRFEAAGCVMFVTVGVQEAQEAELVNYSTLGLLLDRYGSPETVGISEGSLALLAADQTVLLYPDRGIIAIFDTPPDDVLRSTITSRLIFRPPYESAKQVTRLDLRVIDWQPPLR